MIRDAWFDAFDPHEPWDPPRYVNLCDPGYTADLEQLRLAGVRDDVISLRARRQ